MKVVLRLRQEKYSKTSVICYRSLAKKFLEDRRCCTHSCERNKRASKQARFLADEIKGLSFNHMMLALFQFFCDACDEHIRGDIKN